MRINMLKVVTVNVESRGASAEPGGGSHGRFSGTRAR